MQKTSNYQLNQWDAADPIDRKDFNSDNAAIDAALGELSTAVSNAAAANCWVKLTEVTTTENTGAVTLDLSGFDLSRYRTLELHLENAAGTQSCGLKCIVNGDSSARYSLGSGEYTAIGLNFGSAPYYAYPPAASIVRMSTTGTCLTTEGTCYWGGSGGTLSYSALRGVYAGCTLSEVQTLTLTAGSYQYMAGLTVAIYAQLN